MTREPPSILTTFPTEYKTRTVLSRDTDDRNSGTRRNILDRMHYDAYTTRIVG